MLSDAVQTLEERLHILDGLLGELICTLQLPMNQNQPISALDFMVRRWKSRHELTMNRKEGAD